MTIETHFQTSHLDQADVVSQGEEQSINAIIKDVDLITTYHDIKMILTVQVNHQDVDTFQLGRGSVSEDMICLEFDNGINLLEALRGIGFSSLKEAVDQPIQLVVAVNTPKITQRPGPTELCTEILGIRNFLGTQEAGVKSRHYILENAEQAYLAEQKQTNMVQAELRKMVTLHNKACDTAIKWMKKHDLLKRQKDQAEDKALDLGLQKGHDEVKIRSLRGALSNYKGQVKKLKQELAVWRGKEKV